MFNHFSQSAHLECPLINLLHKLGALPNILGFHLLPYIQAVRLCWNAGATIDLHKLEEKASLLDLDGFGVRTGIGLHLGPIPKCDFGRNMRLQSIEVEMKPNEHLWISNSSGSHPETASTHESCGQKLKGISTKPIFQKSSKLRWTLMGSVLQTQNCRGKNHPVEDCCWAIGRSWGPSLQCS